MCDDDGLHVINIHAKPYMELSSALGAKKRLKESEHGEEGAFATVSYCTVQVPIVSMPR